MYLKQSEMRKKQYLGQIAKEISKAEVRECFSVHVFFYRERERKSENLIYEKVLAERANFLMLCFQCSFSGIFFQLEMFVNYLKQQQ